MVKTRDTENHTYLVATIRPWNIDAFHNIVVHFDGDWHLVTDPEKLTPELVSKLNPRYIFFPHWSQIVPEEILRLSECVCFHETDLPFGRGGSPIQNLIARGHKDTCISAIRMVRDLDAGPIYMKRELSLLGSAKEIFVCAAKIVAHMMEEIADQRPVPTPQEGVPVIFRRRTPDQSRIDDSFKTIEQLYDHIRMLDAPEYPRAFLNINGFRLTFGDATLNAQTGELKGTVTITAEATDD
ncbi:MAG: methionyl-tRNA formyltransferase [Deltaproteobacteria bacterium]|nr:methionyl-tRNA formyltransferase [Deltaproteobacteria bacterium]